MITCSSSIPNLVRAWLAKRKDRIKCSTCQATRHSSIRTNASKADLKQTIGAKVPVRRKPRLEGSGGGPFPVAAFRTGAAPLQDPEVTSAA